MSLSSFCSYKHIMDVGKDSEDKLDLASLDFDCICLLECDYSDPINTDWSLTYR